MWNTGCNTISNMLPTGINVLDGENQRLAITVGKGGYADWKSVIFPWCVSNSEVHEKAFRFANVKTGGIFMYMFQDYWTNNVCWSLDVDYPWDQKRVVSNGLESSDSQQPLSALDIYVMPDRVCGLAAQDENDLFIKVFEEAVAVAAAAGAIASAIVAA